GLATGSHIIELVYSYDAYSIRSRSVKTRDRVHLTVFAHIDPDQSLLIVEEEVRERFRQLRLAHTGGTEEQERTRGTIRIGDTGPRAADGIGDRGDGGLLPDQPLTEDAFRPEQLLDLALHEPAGGNARPGRNHLGDVIAGDLVRDHRIRGLTGLGLSLFGFGLGDLLLHGRDLAVEQTGSGLEVRVALGALGGRPQLVELGLELADPVEAGALGLPGRLEAAQLLLLVGEIGAQGTEAFERGGIRLLRQGHVLHLQTVDGAAELIDLDRSRVDLHPQPAGSLVDEVDGLVGQLPAGDVAV